MVSLLILEFCSQTDDLGIDDLNHLLNDHSIVSDEKAAFSENLIGESHDA